MCFQLLKSFASVFLTKHELLLSFVFLALLRGSNSISCNPLTKQQILSALDNLVKQFDINPNVPDYSTTSVSSTKPSKHVNVCFLLNFSASKRLQDHFFLTFMIKHNLSDRHGVKLSLNLFLEMLLFLNRSTAELENFLKFALFYLFIICLCLSS